MELTSSVNRSAGYRVADPLFFNDDVVGVLDGCYILGAVSRQRLAGFRQEQRTSFKHPVVGLVVGLAMAGIPVQAVAGDPLGLWWLTLASPFRIIGSIFMLFFGLYLLWGVIRRHDEPWIVFMMDNGERGFPLKSELNAEVVSLLQKLCEKPPPVAG